MGLTKRQQSYLGFLISDKGVIVEDLLKELFEECTIAIIRGYDNFSYESYTKDAYFDEQKAREAMRKIPSNGTGGLSDSYHIVTGTIDDLRSGRIRDLRTLEILGSPIDRKMIYQRLRDKLIKSYKS